MFHVLRGGIIWTKGVVLTPLKTTQIWRLTPCFKRWVQTWSFASFVTFKNRTVRSRWDARQIIVFLCMNARCLLGHCPPVQDQTILCGRKDFSSILNRHLIGKVNACSVRPHILVEIDHSHERSDISLTAGCLYSCNSFDLGRLRLDTISVYPLMGDSWNTKLVLYQFGTRRSLQKWLMVYQIGTDTPPEIRVYQIPNCFSTKYQAHKN